VADILIPTQGPEDWRRLLADPEKQWRTRYSAKTLAYCWQSAKDFPGSVRKAFHDSPYEVFHDMERLLAIPERRVPLPGKGKASFSDLFVLAKSGDDLVSITVEGKVSESFDVLVGEWLQRESAAERGDCDPEEGTSAPARREASTGKLERRDYLCEKLGLDKDNIADLRYQLLHRTTSALIEAENFNAKHALMLVHSFGPNDEHSENFEEYQKFAARLGAEVAPSRIVRVGERDGIELYLGWVKGEAKWLEAGGDDAWAEKSIEKACQLTEQWFRRLKPFNPRVNLGSVVGHKYPALLSEQDGVIHYARFLNEAGVPWDAIHHQVAVSRWIFDAPHPAATATTPGERRRRIDLALLRTGDFLNATLPATEAGFQFDAFLEFKYLSDYWTLPKAQVFGGDPVRGRESVEADVAKVARHLETGACRLGYVIVFEECDWGFADAFAADAEASSRCRVRFIRGYR